MDTVVKITFTVLLIIGLISAVLAFIGLDGTFLIDWIWEIFIVTPFEVLIDFIGEIIWPF